MEVLKPVEAGGPVSTDDEREFPTTDLGNAERFADHCRNRALFCVPWKKWLVWDGTRWEVDTSRAVERLAKDVVRAIAKEAHDTEDDARRGELLKHALASESASRITAMIRLAQGHLPVSPDKLDRDGWLLNVGNGTIDLRTGKLNTHNPGDLITKICPCDYHPDATSELWTSFLERATDRNEDVLSYLQRAAGYSLTGVTGEECFFFLHGLGRNGKSKFLGALQDVLGEYATTTRAETFMAKKGEIPNDIAALRGARLVAVSETKKGMRFSEGLVKQLTGGDPVPARFLHAEYFVFTPSFKLWVVGNNLPKTNDSTDSFWERVKLVPFPIQIPRKERDKNLAEKLRREATAILAWMVKGCLEWRKEGLEEPGEVSQATTEYRVQNDSIQRFVNECCFVDKNDRKMKIKASELHSAYKRWCDEYGELAESQTELGTWLSSQGFDKKRSNGVWWMGLRLEIQVS